MESIFLILVLLYVYEKISISEYHRAKPKSNETCVFINHMGKGVQYCEC